MSNINWQRLCWDTSPQQLSHSYTVELNFTLFIIHNLIMYWHVLPFFCYFSAVSTECGSPRRGLTMSDSRLSFLSLSSSRGRYHKTLRLKRLHNRWAKIANGWCFYFHWAKTNVDSSSTLVQSNLNLFSSWHLPGFICLYTFQKQRKPFI